MLFRSPAVRAEAFMGEMRINPIPGSEFEISIKKLFINVEGRGVETPDDDDSPTGFTPFVLSAAEDYEKLRYTVRFGGEVDIGNAAGFPLDGETMLAFKVQMKASVTVTFDKDNAELGALYVAASFNMNIGGDPLDPDATPIAKLSMFGEFMHPCRRGSSFNAGGELEINLGVFNVSGAKFSAVVTCNAGPGEAIASIAASVDEVNIEDLTIANVEVLGVLRHRKDDTGIAVQGSIKGYLKLDTNLAQAGAQAALGDGDGDDNEGIDVSLGASAKFFFDTETGEVRLALGGTFEAGPVKMSIAVMGASKEACDLETGNYIDGNITVTHDVISAEASLLGFMKCGGLQHVKHMRQLGRSPVPVAPTYSRLAAATMAPLGAADQFGMCAAAAGSPCGPKKGGGNNVCGAGLVCDGAKRVCIFRAQATGLTAGHLRKGAFNNNRDGACSKCAAREFVDNPEDWEKLGDDFVSTIRFDYRCGPGAGGTVCPAGLHCDVSKASCVGHLPEESGGDDDHAIYSDNYGATCDAPVCSRNGKCGPKNGGAVCPKHKDCVADSEGHHVCKPAGSPGFSDDYLPYSQGRGGACDGVMPLCAYDKRCGAVHGGQVCMSGELCIGNGNKGGRCEPKSKFEKHNPDLVDEEHSENFGGACHACAGGELAECGNADGAASKGGLVCPGDLVCARDPTAEKPEGVFVMQDGERKRTTTVPPTTGVTAATLKNKLTASKTGYRCTSPGNVSAIPDYSDADKLPKVIEVDKAVVGAACVRPDLVSRVVPTTRRVSVDASGAITGEAPAAESALVDAEVDGDGKVDAVKEIGRARV